MQPDSGVLSPTIRTRYTRAAFVLRAPPNVNTMDSPLRTFFRTLADYTVGTVIVMAQLAIADRRRPVPALAAATRK